MATVHDVAAYILAKAGEMPAVKLHKLVYYAQAWSLVWDDRPLFADRIEAWANGPAIPELYTQHRGRFGVEPPWPLGDATRLDADARETVDAVLGYYGNRSAQWLSDLTHREAPWRDAREGLEPGERGHEEITNESLVEYYGAIQAERDGCGAQG